MGRLDGPIVGRAPDLRGFHRDDRAAEMFRAQDLVRAHHSQLPVLGAWILDEETQSPVWKLPQTRQWNLTHGWPGFVTERSEGSTDAWAIRYDCAEFS